MADSDLPLVLGAIRDLRREVREDIQFITIEMEHVEERLMRNITTLAQRQREDRAADLTANADEHRTFKNFIDASEVAQARRDGAMGVFRFGVELLSKHARPLIAIVTALAFGAAVILGHVQIVLGAR